MTNEQLVLKVKITPNIESRISDESCALGVKASGKMSVPTNVSDEMRLALIVGAVVTAADMAATKVSCSFSQSITAQEILAFASTYLEEGSIDMRGKGVSTVPCTTYQTTDKEKGPSTAATVKSH
jgi:hypothetical protein